MPKPPPPMLEQYRRLKARFPDAILLFRLGDFYEMFDADAELISRQLSLVLTSRRFAKGVRLPMCGVPYRQLTVYVSKLLHLGHKVAIADQVETPRQAKGLMKREIIRVITPGTVVEESLLAEKAQNYLVALIPAAKSEAPAQADWGLAAVDLSTGEFVAAQFDGPHAWASLVEELNVLQPSEVLLPDHLAEDETWTGPLQSIRPDRISTVGATGHDLSAARQRLMDHFSVTTLEPYGCEHLPLATSAAGAALHYLQQNQLSDLAHLRNLETYRPEKAVGLDAITRRNLELTATLRDGKVQGSVLSVLDRSVTSMGARLLRRWIQHPLVDLAAIEERLDAVEELCGGAREEERGASLDSTEETDTHHAPGITHQFLRTDLRDLLSGLYDVERIVGRIGFGSANARDMAALRRTIERIPQIKTLLATAGAQRLQWLNENLDELHDVAELIRGALVDNPPILLRDGGLIKQGFHAELNQLRNTAAAGRAWLTEYEAEQRERTGISNLRVRYNQVFGFFVEVPKSKSDLVPDDYERRSTITHAERYVTPALQARESQIISAEDRANELEYEIFVDVRRQVANHSQRLRRAATVLAELDALTALAETATRQGYVRPIIDESRVIDIREGRHPVVEKALGEQDESGRRFIPNDTLLDGETRRTLIITGPNMSGKSVLSRQTALIVLMAQIGSFVPAHAARIGLTDRLFVRAGASDDISQGRSTFLVEMSETAYILRHSTERSLVVLDEVGRGTSTYDGMSLAWAVGEDLNNRVGARTLFATHFHELSALADELNGGVNVSLAAREEDGQVVFLYRLVDGGTDRSYGVQVARLAGVPEHVVDRAKEVMARLEQDKGSGRQRELGTRGQGDEEAGELAVREVGPVYVAAQPQTTLVPTTDEGIQTAVGELLRADVANLTPVEALVLVNDVQKRLRAGFQETS